LNADPGWWAADQLDFIDRAKEPGAFETSEAGLLRLLAQIATEGASLPEILAARRQSPCI
jgi:hypothetical protein